MKKISGQRFDEERALYGETGLLVQNCSFDGPADGESAFKEGKSIRAEGCFFNLRYPFWHNQGLEIRDCRMTELCRAALWYSQDVEITGSRLHGIKALRECSNVCMKDCDILSPEFGWFTRGIRMEGCTAQSEYFMLRSQGLAFRDVEMRGKYSLQYIEDATFENCTFDTKDAFWHGKRITVKNSIIKGEYLAWYSEDVTFTGCKIIGTQPLCYCKGLRLIDCEMVDSDLAFERSEVEATLTAPIVSIKNPLCGHIHVPEVGEIIRDIEGAAGEVIVGRQSRRSESFKGSR